MLILKMKSKRSEINFTNKELFWTTKGKCSMSFKLSVNSLKMIVSMQIRSWIRKSTRGLNLSCSIKKSTKQQLRSRTNMANLRVNTIILNNQFLHRNHNSTRFKTVLRKRISRVVSTIGAKASHQTKRRGRIMPCSTLRQILIRLNEI